MGNKIFISYRRGDDPGFTQALLARLENEFSADQLFIDVDNIPPGLDFVKVLGEQVSQCDALIAIFGPRWLDAKDDAGAKAPRESRRFREDRDRVIPVLVNKAAMPSAGEWPIH
jgi:hypothetical protein